MSEVTHVLVHQHQKIYVTARVSGADEICGIAHASTMLD